MLVFFESVDELGRRSSSLVTRTHREGMLLARVTLRRSGDVAARGSERQTPGTVHPKGEWQAMRGHNREPGRWFDGMWFNYTQDELDRLNAMFEWVDKVLI